MRNLQRMGHLHYAFLSSPVTIKGHIPVSAGEEAAMDVIKVAAKSRPYKVAGAIAGVFREHKQAVVQAIGAGAVNQAVKALILSRQYLAQDGYHVAFIPQFTEIEIQGQVRTAVRFTVIEVPAEMDPVPLEPLPASTSAEIAREEDSQTQTPPETGEASAA